MATLRSAQTAIRPLDGSALNDLMEAGRAGDGPFVSIYLPTERRGADTRKNSIRFKTLAQEADAELKKGDVGAVDEIMRPLHQLAENNDFWQHQRLGLAVFRGPETFVMFQLGRPVEEKAAVADSFHLKPLIRILQDTSRYQLLAVTQKSVRLYEGDLDNLDEVPLHPDVPGNIIAALGGEVGGDLNVNSYGGLSYSGMFHGHHDNKDERDKELERFFRVVDRAIYDHHGRGGDLPMYFAGDVDYQARFKKASHHPRLQKEGVRINPDAVEVDDERLRKEMEQILKPAIEEQTKELVEQFGNAKAKGQGSDEVTAVGEAAFQGRILTLLVDADKSVGGRVDPDSGKVTLVDEAEADVDDVLDDLAEMTLRTGGRVKVIPGEMHPSASGVAAVFRY